MAGRGPAPKPDDKRARRNKPEIETTELAGDKGKRPALPGRRGLLPQTRRWWDTWAGSPQAEQFLATDWQRLIFLIPVVEAYFKGDLGSLTEIRLNEAKLGGTPEDRLRLRWRMRDADQEAERGEKKAAKPKRRGDPRLKLVEGGSA
jgi:hypothetical protein